MRRRTKESESLRQVKIAVCGKLPTVCAHLERLGVIHIDQYDSATDMGRESDYHLILVYAPNAEGLLNTCVHGSTDDKCVPIRLLNEPCCRSMLTEIKLAVCNIARSLSVTATEEKR